VGKGARHDVDVDKSSLLAPCPRVSE